MAAFSAASKHRARVHCRRAARSTGTLLDRFASGTNAGKKIISKLPSQLRRDVISAQLIMFHVTTKLHNRCDFARDLVDKILKNEIILNNLHKMLCLSHVPDDFIHLTKNPELNDEIQSFLYGFSRMIGHHFRHYADLSTFGTSKDVFIELLELRPPTS